MSMSVDGLISGMDTTTLITQLLQAEAGPQTALKTRLTATQTAASAYRTVNTTFAAVRAAAQALTTTTLETSRKAFASNSDAVAVNAKSTAVDGSAITFAVTGLASKQVVVTHAEWASLDADVRTDANGDPQEPAWPLEIRNSDGSVRGTVPVAAGAKLSDAVTAINAANLGVKAAAIKVGTDKYRLQLTGTATGAENAFEVRSDTETDLDGNVGTAFHRTITAKDATVDLGGIVASSATNTFEDLLAGVTITVSKETAEPLTVSVNRDTAGVATKVKTLVDAVNSALNTVRTYTSNAKGSTAALKGDFPVSQLAGQLLDAVSSAIGADGSPAQAGLELSKDGKTIVFTEATFVNLLNANPDKVQRMVAGTAAGIGPDLLPGTADDVAASGVAGRLLAVAKAASDSATGSLVKLAEGQDSMVEDIKNRIEAWDLRLLKRKETLTRQFTAMETALSSLKNQSTWLAGQINSLPKYG
jgi:flagellar hook-associated protein 2